MGVASVLIGVLPTTPRSASGRRCCSSSCASLQGIGVGGEWGGSVTLTMEWGNPRRRGLIASWPQVGVPIGLLLSTGAVSLCSHLTGDAFETWGWRIPFLASVAADRRRPVGAARRARVAAVRARDRGASGREAADRSR